MSWLEALIKRRFPDQRVRVELLPDRDAVRVSVVFSDHDLELWRHDGRVAARAVLAPLEPQRKRSRRLRWAKLNRRLPR